MKKEDVKINQELPLYYNPQYNGFHVVYEIEEDAVILGGCSTFVNGAFTNIVRNRVKEEYMDGLIKINKDNPLSHNFIQFGCRHLPCNLLATESKKDLTYRMFQNKFVINYWYQY